VPRDAAWGRGEGVRVASEADEARGKRMRPANGQGAAFNGGEVGVARCCSWTCESGRR
jgi:hypothetical protein